MFVKKLYMKSFVDLGSVLQNDSFENTFLMSTAHAGVTATIADHRMTDKPEEWVPKCSHILY